MCIFFFNDTATTEIYTLSLHDALPISSVTELGTVLVTGVSASTEMRRNPIPTNVVSNKELQQHASTNVIDADRKSTRLNSSHANISYAVFCLKKKKKTTTKLAINSSSL